MAIAAGQQLLHYRLTEKIGEGGMGEVWKATDTTLGREVAIKIVPEQLAADPERLQRFEREARVVAALNHPNVVTLYSVERTEGLHFITMELVQGKVLSEVTPPQGMELTRLLEVALPLTSAVAAAHEQGITHRDLKPGNVMIGDDGRIKVLDFGLAKVGGEGEGEQASTHMATAVTMTSVGRILGTAAYMSPEQAEGKPLDRRTDVFSLGIVLYEMATGRRPFHGDSHASVISSILRDDPASVTELKPVLPRQLSRILRRCLCKDPQRRYTSALELHNELRELKEELHSGELTPASGLTVRGSRRVPWLLFFGLAAVVLSIWLGVRLRQGNDNPALSSSMRMEQLTSDGESWDAVISPDGRYVARAVRRGRAGGKSSIHLRQLDTGSEVEILAPQDGYVDNLAFSPDGSHIYYTGSSSDGPQVFRLPTLGGTPRVIVGHLGQWAGVSVSSDGSRLVVARRPDSGGVEELTLLAIDGSEERVLTTRKRPESVGLSAWSPNGNTVVFQSIAGDRQTQLVAVDVEDGTERIVADIGMTAPASGLTWMPDGSGLLALVEGESGIRTNQIWFYSFPDGKPRRVTNDASFYDHVTVSEDGRAAVATRHEWTFSIWVLSRLRPESRRVVLQERLISPVSFVELDWLTEGQVVFTRHDAHGPGLSVLDVTSGEVQELTVTDRQFGAPRALPGTQKLLVHERKAGRSDLWQLDLPSGDLNRLVAGVVGYSGQPSADGDGVYYAQEAAEGRFIRYRDLDGEDSRKVWEHPGSYFDISDDQQWLGLSTIDASSGARRIQVVSPADGSTLDIGEAIRLTGRPFKFVPGSQTLSYLSTASGAPNVWIRELPDGEPVQLTQSVGGDISDFAWSRDGDQLAVVVWKDREEVMLIRDF